MPDKEFDESIVTAPKNLRKGDFVRGKVFKILDDGIFLDINYKSEGLIPREEFSSEEVEKIKEGDFIEAVVLSRDDGNGFIRLSKREAEKFQAMARLKEAREKGSCIKVKVHSKNNGGYVVVMVDNNKETSLECFLPLSHAGMLRGRRSENYRKGDILDVLVVDEGRKNKRPIVSRKLYLEENIQKKIEELKGKIGNESRIKGRVVSVQKYGIFVDIDGVDVFVPRSELTWKRQPDVMSLFSPGDDVTLVITEFDDGKRKFKGSIKKCLPDPWESEIKKFSEGDVVEGVVVSITDFGAFVELSDGIEGMLHVSELSWSGNVKKPSDVLKVGERVKVKILKINYSDKKISLSLRQSVENPVETYMKKNPPGTKVRGQIKKVTPGYIVVLLEKDVEGIIRKEDTSWGKRLPDLKKEYKTGESVECCVLGISRDRGNIKLGIKQLTEDPWKRAGEIYKKGTEVRGTVSGLQSYGVFVKLDEIVEGMIPRTECDLEKGKKIEEAFKVGDSVEAIVIESDPGKKRITLSIKELIKKREEKELEKILGKPSDIPKIGDIFGDILKGDQR